MTFDSQGHSRLNGDRDLVKDRLSVLGYEDSDRHDKIRLGMSFFEAGVRLETSFIEAKQKSETERGPERSCRINTQGS